ncbi:hypothetical protein TRVA0_051S00430 [Trichomonascus vanleenenianus]|uniref:uncharacterized protein n=1 Tax=Trichomonascus vanleenenianus TaxID=2268995 RepID=UPI003ECA068A
MCFSLAFWNEKDDILKERMFGLTGHQGNHGEDVKEIYYYLDNTPSHSYMKMLYKYPQKKFPYEELISENAKRSREELEFEIGDTGVFDDDRYFDIFMEMAKDKDNEEELEFRITAYNRGPEAAPLHIIPQVWFRDTWSWGWENKPKPEVRLASASASGEEDIVFETDHYKLGARYVQFATSPGVCDDGEDVTPTPMFTENATNEPRLYNVASDDKYFKDAFHDFVIDADQKAINPEQRGTKAGAWYAFDAGDGIPPGDFVTVRFRFTNKPVADRAVLDERRFDAIVDRRQDEADDFYYKLSPLPMSDELRNVQRQAFSGMLWTKQFYQFIHHQWSLGDPGSKLPPPEERKYVRNTEWRHLHIDDVLSMPDKWEYPFFAAWDTAFHCLPLAMIDPEFAKKQLDLLTREWYMHPNGQIPAYEWNFSDVNPPVHAWATFRVFKLERKLYGREDVNFLERVFQKLLLNFTWWVNRKDMSGKNVFEGGFLGLDNIGLFNRSEPLPTGGVLEQADSTGWMGFFCLQMMNIALELAKHRPAYEDIASKFFEHFLFIADAMTFRSGKADEPLWNEEDGFYYDAISYGGPYIQQLPVRSLVGLIPLYATITLEPQILNKFKGFSKRLRWFVENRPEIIERNTASMTQRGSGERMLLSMVSKERLVKILDRMLDEDEFLSDYGLRSLSKFHKDNPYSMEVNNQRFVVDYLPGESNSGLFGGNSNWRGPIWFPTNFLLIESLQRFYMFYGDDLKVECPKGSGMMLNLSEVAENIQHRLIRLFTPDSDGRRPYNGDKPLFDSEHFSEYLHFNEYFHADTGRGLGSEHQCGWTGLVAKLIHDTGVRCMLPRTPKTPIGAADYYFDEELGTPKRRLSRGRPPRLQRRYSLRSGYTTNDEEEDLEVGDIADEEDEAHYAELSEHVRKSFKKLNFGGGHEQELETRMDGSESKK